MESAARALHEWVTGATARRFLSPATSPQAIEPLTAGEVAMARLVFLSDYVHVTWADRAIREEAREGNGADSDAAALRYLRLLQRYPTLALQAVWAKGKSKEAWLVDCMDLARRWLVLLPHALAVLKGALEKCGAQSRRFGPLWRLEMVPKCEIDTCFNQPQRGCRI